MKSLFRLLARVGPSEAPVLLVGESGTGKEVAARALHQLSDRREGRFVAVNCAAIPETLIEGELFGHEKGAFTGAMRRQLGCFELAHGGTLFLDELASMPTASQVKLLRALEQSSFRRLRGSEEVRVDVRVVAAINQDPDHAVSADRLRADLLYRIRVFTLSLPSLRERVSDIPLLARHFVQEFAERSQRKPPTLAREAEEILLLYEWPGNVRELRNAMERAVILAEEGVIRAEDLPPGVRRLRAGTEEPSAAHEGGSIEEPSRTKSSSDGATASPPIEVGMTLDEASRALLLSTLEATRFNKTRTAEILGVSAKTVYNKLRGWAAGGDARAQHAEAAARGARSRSEDVGGLPPNEKTARLVSIDAARQRRRLG